MIRPLVHEDAWPLVRALRGFLGERQPRGVGWAQTLGSLLLALFALQGLTGILLALYYAPSTDAAWESLRYIEEEVTLGSFIRGLHHYGASAFVIVLVAHMSQVFLHGAYQSPRRLLWVLGVLLLLVGLGFGYTGYLLPWDLKAYFGTQVGTAIPGSIPIVGPIVSRLLRGGEGIDQLTLSRFYALHVLVLPLATLLLVALHVFFVRALGVTPPWRRRGEGEREEERQGEPFHPYQLARDSIVAVAGIGVLAILALDGAPLEDKADPSVTDYVPAPEWYFLGLQHLLRIVPAQLQILATAVVPGILVLVLFLVPWLDRSLERRLARRPVFVSLYLAGLVLAIGLTCAGYGAVEAERVRRASVRAEEDAGSPLAAGEPATPEALSRGKELYEALRCGGCHPEEGPPVDYAPAMGFAGSRTPYRWLVRYLLEPYRIYYAEEGVWPEARMPTFRLAAREAEDLAAYLASRLDDDLVPPGRVDPSELADEAAVRGEALVREKLCLNCHQLGEEGGRVGPDLTRVGSRLAPDYLYAIVENPFRINIETTMKRLGLGHEEIRDIVAFLVRQR